MDDIINDFIAESAESLETLDQKFVELEKNPGDLPLLNDIFRSIHTIKGAAGFLGFDQMVEVTHVTEDVLNKLRKSEMRVTPAVMDAILRAVDMIRVILANIREKNGKKEDTSGVMALLGGILSGEAAVPQDESAPALPDKQAADEDHKQTRADP
ncbi:MAG: Hpt domain-containing protein [Candidatus Methylomirabilis sp.]|nr:Hpt domain-containing protein [Deltaproteobacteria bacterium]